MFEFIRGNHEQKSRQILEATRGLSSTDLEGTHLIECLRSQLSAVTEEIKRLRQENATLTAERDALFVLTDRLTAEHDALRAERDEVRQSYCSLMEAYRGGDGRVTANKLGWGYLFEEDKPCQ